MRKFKLYYDKDAEEVWLREMPLQGWAFKKFFLGVYTLAILKVVWKFKWKIEQLQNQID